MYIAEGREAISISHVVLIVCLTYMHSYSDFAAADYLLQPISKDRLLVTITYRHV